MNKNKQKVWDVLSDPHPRIDGHGTMWYYDKDGDYHRDNDKPAIIYPNELRIWWFKHGLLHRDRGPAIIDNDSGNKWWYKNGIRLSKYFIIRRFQRLIY